MVEEPLEFISMAEAARLTGLSAYHIQQARDSGELPSYRIGTWPKLRWSEVQAWIETCRTEPACPTTPTP